MITCKNNRIIVKNVHELTVVEPYGNNCIRCRSTRNTVISDESWTLLPAKPCECTITQGERTATLVCGDLTAVVEDCGPWNSGRIVFYRKGKQILRRMYESDPANAFVHTEGDHYRITVTFEANRGEHLYGLGQETQDFFDRKGCTTELLHRNTKSTIPYLYSSLGYGFLWNNPAPGRCETANNRTLWSVDSAYQADYLVLTGDTPADVARLYADLTGYAPKFPAWASGFWQCKLRYEDQEELLEVAREYKRRGIPVSAIVIDYFHWTEQGEWKFDPKYWPDPEGLCRELKEMEIQPIVSIWPTINPKSENFAAMQERDMLIRTETGQYGTFSFYGQQTFIDPMNPATGKYVFDIVKKNYFDKGIRNYWLDEAEPEVHPQQFWHLHFFKGNGAQTAMLYPYYYAKMFYDGLKDAGEEEIVLLTRAAWPGSQRFGSAVWNGDIMSDWRALRQSVVSGLSMAVCGIPWWNSDIGGFHLGDTQSEDFRELLIRWFQFGLFCPIMRLHGARKRIEGAPVRNPGIIEPSGGPNEIWRFGDEAYEIISKLIALRQRLRPYIHRCMEEASASGMPVMRPMFYAFPEDEHCYALDDQYMFGGEILFAPILNAGQVERNVYLPKGRWVLTKDGTRYDGNQVVAISAQLHEFIALVPENSELISLFDGH